MGEFDRHQNQPRGNDTRKAVMALVLGVVLIIMLANWYLKSPPAAVAGVPAAVSAGASPFILSDDMSPTALAQLQTQLNSDPTGALLLDRGTAPATDAPALRNPFRVAPAWQARLIRQAAPQVVADPQPRIAVEPQPTPPRPEIPALRSADYKLQSLFVQNGQRSALINSREVRVGDVVGKARVLEIRDNAVILQHLEAPNAPPITLSMPSLNTQ
jgi:hypothetical protein